MKKVDQFGIYEKIVLYTAKRALPHGFNLTGVSEQVDTLDKITAMFKSSGRVTVWTGASEDTIFSKPVYNWVFRAWHDLIHIKKQYPFTQDGEKLVERDQISEIKEACKEVFTDQEINLACQILTLEISGQAEYFHNTGEFPKDQKAFILSKLAA